MNGGLNFIGREICSTCALIHGVGRGGEMAREFFSLFDLAIWQCSHGAEEGKEIILHGEAELLICCVFENGIRCHTILLVSPIVIVLLALQSWQSTPTNKLRCNK